MCQTRPHAAKHNYEFERKSKLLYTMLPLSGQRQPGTWHQSLSPTVLEPVSQSVSQPDFQSVTPAVKQVTLHLVSQTDLTSVGQSVSQSVSQPVSQTDRQSDSLSVGPVVRQTACRLNRWSDSHTDRQLAKADSHSVR